ncbi:hypothetical protein B0H16DRAFT_1467860 [Mycena metata]|uniref:Uncharacterized protein n=1 Tax=Mycena metata TaxID=1033252 RepID=A0AAD7MWN3_9AGAR|nr:hypothetical protein B0H16DRAFT_1467860 [Mycena metata]
MCYALISSCPSVILRRLVSCLTSFRGPPAVLPSRLVIFPKSISPLSHHYIPNSMVRCAGCQNDFKGKGYTLHLKLTHNPPCVAIFEAAEARTVHQKPSAEFGNIEIPAGPFEGDFFGEGYTPVDFGYVDDSEDDGPPSNDPESDPESDDEIEAQERADLAGGYEPPRPQRGEDDPMPPRDENPDPAVAPPTREVRKAAEDHFHHKPIVEKYHSALAGKPIVNPKAQSSEQAYASSLNDLTAANPYAPFTSKLDWEVAKWAKLR